MSLSDDEWFARLQAYLVDCEKMVRPKEARAEALQQHSQQWGMLAVKNAFIANAGGAGVIPIVDRLLQSSGPPPDLKLNLLGAITCFAFGILFAAATALLAYLNFEKAGQASYADAGGDRLVLIKRHFNEAHADGELEKYVTRETSAGRWVTATYRAAIGTGILAYLLFLAGVLVAMP